MSELSIPLVRGDKQSDYDYRDLLPVNLTAVSRSIKGDSGYLISHDGLSEFATTSGKARGGVYNERLRKHLRVSGEYLEEVKTDGTTEVIGVIPGNDICSFANSFNSQAIVAGGKLFLYDGQRLTQVGDQDLGFPIDIAWFNGIYVMTDGENIFHTNLQDESSIDPLAYLTSEFSADPTLAVARNDQNQIIAFNRYSIEYFRFRPEAQVGTELLALVQGKTTRIGIVGTHCKTELDGLFFILGGRREESPSVHILNGGQEATIATREIDKLIAQYSESELKSVYMESRAVDRDKFVIIHLPNETLLYNHSVANKFGIDAAWTILKSGVDESTPYRAKFGLFEPRLSKWIYGDTIDSKLGYLDGSCASQYGEAVESQCYTPMIPLEAATINEFEIETIAGYATSDFSSKFSLSYDGVTFGESHHNKISTTYGYNKRYIVRRLGYIRQDFSIQFQFASKDKMSFSGLKVRYD